MFKILSITILSFVLISCSSPEPKSDEIEKDMTEKLFNEELELAKAHALATKQILGKNLISKIGAEGTVEALSFCNIQAIPLTDSMSNELNVNIKRVSDLPRNPDNQASSKELEYIHSMKELLSNGEEVKPKLMETDYGNETYIPIITNALCLQCHGQVNSDILPETMEKLNNLYSEDKAIGYGVNEIRGIWVVEMAKK